MRAIPLIFVGLAIGFAIAFTSAATVQRTPLCTGYECPLGLP
jgi:hypothetical protein